MQRNKLEIWILRFMLETVVTIIGLYVFYVLIGIPELKRMLRNKTEKKAKQILMVSLLPRDQQLKAIQQMNDATKAKTPKNNALHVLKWLFIPLLMIVPILSFKQKTNIMIGAIRTCAAVILGEFLFFEFFFNRVVILGRDDLASILKHQNT